VSTTKVPFGLQVIIRGDGGRRGARHGQAFNAIRS
jgi:hypothetical protein